MGFESKLIECVEGFECVYNLEHKDYGDTKLKRMAWKQISRTLNENVRECKKQWHHLRDSFRRVIKKRKLVEFTGVSSSRTKKWRFEDKMQFLLPHIKIVLDDDDFSIEHDHDSQQQSETEHNILLLDVTNKPNEFMIVPEQFNEAPVFSRDHLQDTMTSPVVNLNIIKTEKGIEKCSEAPIVPSDLLQDTTPITAPVVNHNSINTEKRITVGKCIEAPIVSSDPVQDTTPTMPPVVNHNSINTEKRIRVRKCIEATIASPSPDLLKDTAKTMPAVNHNIINPERDQRSNMEIDLFFASIGSTVKKLSAFNQAMAKARIFSIVSQLELEELSHGRVPSNYRAAQPTELRGSHYPYEHSLMHSPRASVIETTSDDEDIKVEFQENYSKN